MLTLTNISKQFNGKPVLQSVNLDIQPHQTLAIVGPSGAGKTTLLRIIAGLETPDTGEFTWNGKPTSPQALRTQGIIGLVFQNFGLFPQYTVAENVLLAPRLQGMPAATQKQRLAELLAQLGLTEQQDQYPNQLSGGQKQRVAIARALILQPQILLYDEPTSALDPGLRQSVADLVQTVKQQGTTQVIITHDMDFAQQVADFTYQVSPQAVQR